MAYRYCPFPTPLAIAPTCPPRPYKRQHKVAVAATVIESFERTDGIREAAVMRKLGAQSDGSPLLVIEELVIGGRPITEKKFGWRNGSILLVNRSYLTFVDPEPEGFSASREPLTLERLEQSHFWTASFSVSCCFAAGKPGIAWRASVLVMVGQALQPIDSSHEHLCSFQWCRVRGRISDVMETAEGVVMMGKMMRQYHILKRERDGFQKVPAYPG